MAYQIELRDIEPQPTAVLRDQVARKEIEMRLAAMIPEIQEKLEKQGGRMSGKPFARYHNFGVIERINVDLEVGLPVAAEIDSEGDLIPGQLPGCQAAVLRYQGPHDQIELAYEALQEWIEHGDYESAGTPWESYSTELGKLAESDEWDIEINWPVKAG